MCLNLKAVEITLVGKMFRFLLKFRVIIIVLTLLNPNMSTKFPYHPQKVRRKD